MNRSNYIYAVTQHLLFGMLFGLPMLVFGTSTGDGEARIVQVTDAWTDDINPTGINDWRWEEDENLAAWNPDVDYYLSWDDDNLYLAKKARIEWNPIPDLTYWRENEQPFVFYIHADYPGATFNDFSTPYENHNHDFSNMQGINFTYYMRAQREEEHWPFYGNPEYHEFRNWTGSSWSSPNASDSPPYFNNAGTASHMEISIPWNTITNGNGRPSFFRIFMQQYRLDPWSGEACHPDHFITNESPHGTGAGVGEPTNGVNDGQGAIVTQANGAQCGQENSSIFRWWGCYPVIGGISPRDYNGGSLPSDAGDDQDLCDATSTSLNAPQAGGLWEMVSKPLGASDPVIDDPSNNATAVSGLELGVYEFQYTLTNNACNTFLSDTMRIVNATFQEANVLTALIEVCADFATIAGNDEFADSTYWEALDGGNLVRVDTNVTTVTGLPAGVARFVWHLESAACGNSTDTLTVFRYVNPVADAGLSQALCEATSGQLEAINPQLLQGTATGLWASVATNPSAVNYEDIASYNSKIDLLQAGDYEFIWTVSNGVCPADSDTVQITVGEVLVPSAGQDIELCLDTFTTLNGSPVGGNAVAYWKLISGAAVNVEDSSNSTTNITGMTPGSYVLGWHIENGSCPTQIDSVVVAIYDTPIALAGEDTSFCDGLNYNLQANDPVLISDSAHGSWRILSGALDTILDDPTDHNTAIPIIPYAEMELVWTVTNGTCGNIEDTILLANYTSVTAQAGEDQTWFDQGTAQLSGNDPSLDQITAYGQWSLINFDTPGMSIVNASSPTSFVTGLDSGRYELQWNINNGICPVDSDQVILTIHPSPIADAGNDRDLCDSTSATLTGNDPAQIAQNANGEWLQIAGVGVNIQNPTNFNTLVTGLDTGEYHFTWAVTNLDSTVIDTVVWRNFTPTFATAQADTGICNQTELAIAGSSYSEVQSTATGTWTQTGGPEVVTIKTNFLPTTDLEGLDVNGDYRFRWTVRNGGCPLAFDEVVVTVRQSELPDAGSDLALCDQNTVTLVGSTPINASPAWEVVSGPAVIKSPNTTEVIVENLSAGIHEISYAFADEFCGVSVDTIQITIDALPTTAAAMPDVISCEIEELEVFAESPTIGNGTWSMLSGGTIDNDTALVTDITNLSVGELRVFWTVDNGVCPVSVDTIVINNTPNPTLTFSRMVALNEGQSYIPKISASTAITVNWTPTDYLNQTDTLQPTITPLDDIQFWIEFTDDNGCEGVDSLYIDIAKRIEPSTGFSPSTEGGGANDTWEIVNLDTYPDAVVQIFNRWGNELFASEPGYTNPWDGKTNGELLPFGTYFYVINLGTGAPPLKGTLFLIR